ncbi:MAG: rRNA maturation RNase YbeY [bacterium]|nr:rRNA maturation RNase YbeY [bacterium]
MADFLNLAKIKIKKNLFEKIIKLVLGAEKKQGQISVVLVDSQEIKKINKKYRGKNEITDVISFSNKDVKNKFFLPEKEKELGEIFLCPKELKKIAREAGTDFNSELIKSFIHGILHLLGYGHKNKKESLKMERKEKKYFQTLTDKRN